MGNIFLLRICLVNASKLPFHGTRWFSISFVLGSALTIILILLSLPSEDLILQLIIVMLAIIFTLLSVVVTNRQGRVE